MDDVNVLFQSILHFSWPVYACSKSIVLLTKRKRLIWNCLLSNVYSFQYSIIHKSLKVGDLIKYSFSILLSEALWLTKPFVSCSLYLVLKFCLLSSFLCNFISQINSDSFNMRVKFFKSFWCCLLVLFKPFLESIMLIR